MSQLEEITITTYWFVINNRAGLRILKKWILFSINTIPSFFNTFYIKQV